MNTTPPLWKASVTVTKAEAPDIVALFELMVPAPQAVLIAEELFKDESTVEALYTEPPDEALLVKLTGKNVSVEALPDQDWILKSQQGLPPVRAGRFFVYGAHDKGKVPYGVIPIRIEAAFAFGTGHHETTALCLGALSDLAKRHRFARVFDLGCGTGLLAIGAAKLWKRHVLASDIDPVAVTTTHDNAAANDVAPLVWARLSDGLDSPEVRAHAPFDLIVANILAGPLTHLAPGIVKVLQPGGVLVLSGLLRNQENLVLSFYRALGLRSLSRRRQGPWSALVLEKPAR